MVPSFLGLAAYKQFILCRFVPKENGKTDKIPTNPYTLENSNPQDPSTWLDATSAQNLCGSSEWGLGFVFTNNDPFFFFDLDNCLMPDGSWSQTALYFLSLFQGCAVEVSHSGKGLHIIGKYSGVSPPHKCKNKHLGIELYTSDRFVALTQTNAIGDCGAIADEAFNFLINNYFAPDAEVEDQEWRTTPVDEWFGPDDDDILVDKMMHASSAASIFGNKASPADLWKADAQKLAIAYPPIGEGIYDRSSADAALASHLAFWTGKNHDRIERLMRRSGLVRDKWDKHRAYLKTTIKGAVNRCKSVYCVGKPTTPPEPIKTIPNVFRDEPLFTTGSQFMGAAQIAEYFKGCVYVQDRHRMFTPGGQLLKPEQVRATYGGFEFAMNNENSKTTRNAWEVFVEGQAVKFPRVTGICFRPELEPGVVISEEGHRLVNTYTPITTVRRTGDITPFTNFMMKVLPDENDREIFLSYMAAVVQYPGVKFQWCPLLQGAEGNGKTLFARCVAFSVGHRYTHFPNASDLGQNGSKFNLWIQNKLFIGIEEIYVSDRREVSEALKPLITNDRIEIQGKGQDQVTGDNRANFMMFTNHQDAVIVTIDSRRYCVLYSAQQTADDIKRDGMSGDYFPKLYAWLKNGGYEIVNDYLHTYQIKEHLNPATSCHRAPVTTSTSRAVALSLGPVEQEVLEAIEEGRQGFSGGWISSHALTKLLERTKMDKRVPQVKRRAMLQKLGYDYHPGLEHGRVHNIITAEGTKPRLFIRMGHIHSNLTKPSLIVEHYIKAQNYIQLSTPDSALKN